MKLISFVLILLFPLLTRSQEVLSDDSSHRWSVLFSFEHDPYVTGYVQVRESEYAGDKLSLSKDLGMDHWNSFSAYISYSLNKQWIMSGSYQYYLFSGSNKIGHDFWFNGTHADGEAGVSAIHSQLTKTELNIERMFDLSPGFQVGVIGGVIYHSLLFVIDGTVLPDTYRNELYERFLSQALPYPEIGLQLKKNLSLKSAVSIKAQGTYIPYFGSFFYEGGQVHLHYHTMITGLTYRYSVKQVSLLATANYVALRTYEYSSEDTNDFSISSFGIQLSLGYRF